MVELEKIKPFIDNYVSGKSVHRIKCAKCGRETVAHVLMHGYAQIKEHDSAN